MGNQAKSKKTNSNTPTADVFSDALFEHYVEPYAKSKTLRAMKALIDHELTCDNPKHMHGFIKVKWDKHD